MTYMFDLTPWISAATNPTRIGLYQTATEEACDLGYGYMHWNGTIWTRYKSYADYTVRRDMVWRGLAHEVKEPSYTMVYGE